MICEFCGGETVTRKVRKQHWLASALYIVENVEAEVCVGAVNVTFTRRCWTV